MVADYQLSLQDYLAIARRWLKAIILTFGAVLTISVVVAMLQPRVYESKGTLLAEPPQLSGEWYELQVLEMPNSEFGPYSRRS